MALSINILYDGESNGVVVNQHTVDADSEQLLRFIERWKVIADEPCMHGHKCETVKRMLGELEEIMKTG